MWLAEEVRFTVADPHLLLFTAGSCSHLGAPVTPALLLTATLQVEPVMRKHQLFVPLLSEMQPQRPTPGPDVRTALSCKRLDAGGVVYLPV